MNDLQQCHDDDDDDVNNVLYVYVIHRSERDLLVDSLFNFRSFALLYVVLCVVNFYFSVSIFANYCSLSLLLFSFLHTFKANRLSILNDLIHSHIAIGTIFLHVWLRTSFHFWY